MTYALTEESWDKEKKKSYEQGKADVLKEVDKLNKSFNSFLVQQFIKQLKAKLRGKRK